MGNKRVPYKIVITRNRKHMMVLTTITVLNLQLLPHYGPMARWQARLTALLVKTCNSYFLNRVVSYALNKSS